MVCSGSPTTARSVESPSQQLEQPFPERVGVLVLVDAEPGLAGADEGRGGLVGLEQGDGLEQHVLVVDEPGAVLRPLVSRVHPREEVGRHGCPFAPHATQRRGEMPRTLAHSMVSARPLTAVKR